MFEAERVLMSNHVIIPIYTYVTKRLVNPHLRGWRNNVMDHHPTRHMFLLKSRMADATDEAPSAGSEVAPATDPLSTAAGDAPVEAASPDPDAIPEDAPAPESEPEPEGESR